MFPVTKPQQYVSAASLTSNVDTEIQDSVATMKVCRVCLAMTIKMYHLSDHKLNVMYEQVTGIEINTEDMLPKMLCWECVARLSSASNFKEKALKTQWILINKVDSGRVVTINDIESIDKAQHQLESTLGFKVHTEDDSNYYTIKESDKTDDHFYIETHKLFVKSEPGFCELNDDINNEEEQTIIPEVNIHDGKDPIKREYFDSEEKNVSDEDYNTSSLFVTVEIEKEENINDRGIEMAFDNVSVFNEAIDEENHILEATRNMNWRAETLPHCKELRVDNQNAQDSLYQFTAQSSKDSAIAHHTQIKEEILDNNFVDKITIYVPGVSTGTVDSNISFMQNETKPSKKAFVCDLCGGVYNIKSALIRHIKKHPKMHSCTYCSYNAYQLNDLKKHINIIHTKKKSYNCSFCSYIAFAKSTLTKHVNAKHTKANVYNCSHCSYTAYYKGGLIRHVNAKHTKKEVYTCSFCDYVTHDKGILTRHVNAKHTRTNIYNCPYCNYTAYNKWNLNIHINVKHTKTKVYNCSYCSHRAFNQCALTRHVNAKHTKANAYKCSHCIYKTFDKSCLIRHINALHTKSITYNCSLCDYKSYLKSGLSRHIKAHAKSTVNVNEK